MASRNWLAVAFEVVVLLFVVALLAGQFLGQPVLLGFVETGSMSPTIDAGDGFVAIPTALEGPVHRGDVIVYNAEELHGGGLVTHRVVGETDRGYITRGDANPFSDQDGTEPPVKDAQIVATALQVGGSVVTIPHLGTAVMAVQGGLAGAQRWLAATLGSRTLLGPQGLAYLLLGVSAIGYVADLLLSDPSERTRARTRNRDTGYSTNLILAGLALLLVTSATAAMVVPAGTHQFGVVSAEFQSDRPTVIRTGHTSDMEYRLPNAGLVPVHVYLEPASDGVAVEPHHRYVPGQGTASATVTLSAPQTTGYYRRFLVEHRYLAILPKGVIDALYRVHHWLPILAIDVLLGGGVFVTGWFLLGRGRVRIRRRMRDQRRPILLRIKRFLTGME